MKINVLSLFGGIECGRVAMDRLGWEVRNYFSSEVDNTLSKLLRIIGPILSILEA